MKDAALAALRAELDQLDDALVDLLSKRAELVGQVWAWKAAHGVTRFDPEREAAQRDRLRARAVAAGLDPDAVARVLATVIGQALR